MKYASKLENRKSKISAQKIFLRPQLILYDNKLECLPLSVTSTLA